MSILINENNSTELKNTKVVTNSTLQNDNNESFVATMTQIRKQKESNNTEETKDEDSEKKTVEELLNEIRKIVNSGINPAVLKKIDELKAKIKDIINNAEKNQLTIEAMQNLIEQLQETIAELKKNSEGDFLGKSELDEQVDQLSSKLEEKKANLNMYGGNTFEKLTLLDDEKELSEGEELEKFMIDKRSLLRL